MPEYIEIKEPVQGCVECILNRPDKRNALNLALLRELTAFLSTMSARILIIRGNGPVFCAGLDLKEAKDPHIAHESASLIGKALLMIAKCPAVTIAAVHGAAMAGGSGLMTACDFAIAKEGTVFGYPEVHRGLVAGLVMGFLRRQLLYRHVTELLLTGKTIDASYAKEIGLVNQVTADVDAAVQGLIKSLLEGGPNALAMTKELLAKLGPTDVDDDIALALDFHVKARTSGEAKEGLLAFAEKRKPLWAGNASL